MNPDDGINRGKGGKARQTIEQLSNRLLFKTPAGGVLDIDFASCPARIEGYVMDRREVWTRVDGVKVGGAAKKATLYELER